MPETLKLGSLEAWSSKAETRILKCQAWTLEPGKLEAQVAQSLKSELWALEPGSLEAWKSESLKLKTWGSKPEVWSLRPGAFKPTARSLKAWQPEAVIPKLVSLTHLALLSSTDAQNNKKSRIEVVRFLELFTIRQLCSVRGVIFI